MPKVSPPAITVLTLTTSLLIIHFISGWDWPVIVSLVLGMSAVIVPKIAIKIDFGWKVITRLVGVAIQQIVLTLIFYFILTPVALISRWVSKRDPLNLSNRKSSTFADVNKTFQKKEFEKPW